jgi:hypothetical protein
MRVRLRERLQLQSQVAAFISDIPRHNVIFHFEMFNTMRLNEYCQDLANRLMKVNHCKWQSLPLLRSDR